MSSSFLQSCGQHRSYRCRFGLTEAPSCGVLRIDVDLSWLTCGSQRNCLGQLHSVAFSNLETEASCAFEASRDVSASLPPEGYPRPCRWNASQINRTMSAQVLHGGRRRVGKSNSSRWLTSSREDDRNHGKTRHVRKLLKHGLAQHTTARCYDGHIRR